MSRKRITVQLTILYVLICLVPTVLACAIMIAWQQRQANAEHERRLEGITVLLAELFADGVDPVISEDLQRRTKAIAQRVGVRVTLVAAEGRVVADTESDSIDEIAQMDNHRNRPEIVAAAEQGEGSASRFSDTVGSRFFYHAKQLERDGICVGFVRTSLRESTMQENVIRNRKYLAWLALMIGGLNLLMIYYAVTRFIKRLDELRLAADAIADGEYHQHVAVADHIDGGLSRSFNRMSKELATNVDSLRVRGDQLATVLDGMVEGVIAIDDQQRVLFANRSAGGLLGFNDEKSAGKSLLETVRLQPLHAAAEEAFRSGERAELEADVGGSLNRALAVRASPLPGTPCPGVVLVILDVTELRRLEGLRQEFIANVSHELKTPLSSIKAFSETLLNGALRDHENNERFVMRISDQANRLQQLIMDMLSLARIESAKQSYEITPVSLSAAVSESLLNHLEAANEKSIKLVAQEPADPLAVRAEPEAVRQILDNLIKNAVMYTGEGGTVTVSWGRSANEHGAESLTFVDVRVSDTGIGIAEEHRARLFERFFRVDKARSREQGGTGLGLSIVKHLTQFFGGTVSVESELGEGTTFLVRLPEAEC